jgi:hypothetical protein
MRTKTAILCVAFASSHLAFAQNRPVSVASNGETAVSASLEGKYAKALFHTSSVSVTDSENRRFAQCTSSRIPCSLTSQLKIFWNDSEVFVPRSAYADLGDISTAQLSVANGRMILAIRGGDASEGYIAKLEFNKERVVMRSLYSAEDTSHPLEVSRYYVVSASGRSR